MKYLYEFYYSLLKGGFLTVYRLDIERETEKMFYGNAVPKNSFGNMANSKFAVNKNVVGSVIATKDYVYRITVDDGSFDGALQKAKDLMFKFLSQQAEQVKMASVN